MDELLKMKDWVESLYFDWMGRGKEEQQVQWLKERDNAAFHWAWNHALRQVVKREKTMPLDAQEEKLLSQIETALEASMYISGEVEEEYDLLYYVTKDFDLLARAARVDVQNEWLDKLRAEYEAGRFPRGTL